MFQFLQTISQMAGKIIDANKIDLVAMKIYSF